MFNLNQFYGLGKTYNTHPTTHSFYTGCYDTNIIFELNAILRATLKSQTSIAQNLNSSQ